ncbi:hypothetical protein FT643_01710 [Ketobacter sp. MCCC 1A13808]|uniref:hypothetical protein n=1 Tax=Ketobacter sp. MCCC 1A13808 TaxID=2602738 RepID=UPI0012EC8EC5|nr:hypothetical protein [Ketobacter sp. MCCC 1A13808]MVF10846.1 hypothetical protein [Ketobacter sp. MCCC 1A13808]
MGSVQDSRYLGGVNELTIITDIKKGRTPDGVLTYKQMLQRVLDSVQNREERGIPTPIRLIETIHFARWVIWQHGESSKLIFTSNYDGSMWQYLRDFSNTIATDIDRVWSNCEGYPPGGCRDFDSFWAYVVEHQVATSAFYAALPQQTLRRRDSLRRFKTNFDQFVVRYGESGQSDPEGFYKQFQQFVLSNQSYLSE